MQNVFYVTSLGNVSLFATCQAGLVNNLNDGMSWGLYPLFFAAYGLGIGSIGIIKAVYPMVWGVLQVVTGPLSDRVGRKELIAWRMIVQSGGIWLTVLVPTYVALAGRRRVAGTRDGDGLPDASRRDRGPRAPCVVCDQPRRLPLLARWAKRGLSQLSLPIGFDDRRTLTRNAPSPSPRRDRSSVGLALTRHPSGDRAVSLMKVQEIEAKTESLRSAAG